MRTTLTVNDDIDARFRKIAREQNRAYKDVLNEALAQGIEALEVAEPREHYQVESAAFGLKPGIDSARRTTGSGIGPHGALVEIYSPILAESAMFYVTPSARAIILTD